MSCHPSKLGLAVIATSCALLSFSCAPLPLFSGAAGGDALRELYRVDVRSPAQVFASGFTPCGRNDYLLAHVLGTSLLADHECSFFVAATESLQTAYMIAQRKYQFDPYLQERPLYIYSIRADSKFYGVDRYMEYVERDPPEGESQGRIAELRQGYGNQREWVAAGGIPPRQIRMAREISFRMGSVIGGSEFANVDYEDADTHANDGVYPPLGLSGFSGRLGGKAFILNSEEEFKRGFAVSLAYCFPVADEKKNSSSSGGCENPTIIDLDSD